MSNNVDVLVVGAGTMAKEYVKVCLELGRSPLVVTRGEPKARELAEDFPCAEVIAGGLRPYLSEHEPPDDAILATPIDTLRTLCLELIESGVDRILAEKPLTLTSEGGRELSTAAMEHETAVYIAFNRRHYASVEMARERITEAGGVSSFHFDFTEALFRIDPSKYATAVTERWGIANSSHVIDMAFALCGSPDRLDAHQTGSAVPWHPTGSIFYGNGRTETGTPFTYHSNWGGPGRWGLEINTSEEKLLFEPLERLKVQPAGQFDVVDVDGDYSNDQEFKPGLYRQSERFFEGRDEFLLSLEDWPSEIEILESIFGYGSGN